MNGKKILSLLLSVVCAFGAAACREQEEPPQKTPYELYAEVPVVYEKQTAAYEDSALSLWFDHAFSKTVRQDVTPTGRDTYKIYMGKNEKENCQFFLSGAEDKTFSVSATDFRSETGDTVPVSLYYQYYFEMDYEGERQDVPDAIPPVKEGAVFTVRAEESAGFVLQAKTSPDTPSGDYTAELTVLNEAGQEVKTATVFLHVWDFTLSEDTVCRTAMWVDKNRLGGHDYQTLYDYLLENRVNAYDLPYALSDPAVDEYLDNPRVNSFNILGFKFNRESGKSEGQIRDAMTYAYEKLSPVAAWKEKGYFYLVDEPNVNESHKLNWIAEYGQWLEEQGIGPAFAVFFQPLAPPGRDGLDRVSAPLYQNLGSQDDRLYHAGGVRLDQGSGDALSGRHRGDHRQIRRLSRPREEDGTGGRRGSVVVCDVAAFRSLHYAEHDRAGRRIPRSVLAAETVRRKGIFVLEHQLLVGRRLECL